MDVEDVTHPNRMKIQYALKEEGLEITVCGSWVRISGEDNPGVLPTSQKGILWMFIDCCSNRILCFIIR